MTCDDILVQLLDADPDELRGDGRSDVAAHVRSCARCRSVATTLLGDTALLGAAVAHSSGAVPDRRRAPHRARRVVPWLAPVGLAAAGIAAIAIGRGELASPVGHLPTHEPLAAVAPVSAETAAVPGLPPPAAVVMTPILARSVEVAAFPMPEAVQPDQVGAPIPDPATAPDLVVIAHRELAGAADSAAAPVIVTPHRGTDARVTHSRNAKITIVWITDAQ